MKAPHALRYLLAAPLIAGSALGLAACGSADTATTAASTRAASANTTCSEKKSEARYITFTNELRTNLTLEVPRASWRCDGFSGTATPGEIDGLRIGSTSGVIRLEMIQLWSSTASKAEFGLRILAGATTLANLTLEPFLTSGMDRRLGIVMDGTTACDRALEGRDPSGNPIWIQVVCGKGTYRDQPWQVQITGTKPT